VKTDEAKSSFTVIHGGKAEALTFRKDYIVAGDPTRTDVSVEAPVAFVAYGVTAPDQNYDDYKQIDANGKIVAMLASAPKFQSAGRAHYSSPETKAGNAVAHGAVGIILIDDPIFEQLYSFDKRVRDLVFPGYRWLDKQGRPNDHFLQLKGVANRALTLPRSFSRVALIQRNKSLLPTRKASCTHSPCPSRRRFTPSANCQARTVQT
jgi:PA domain